MDKPIRVLHILQRMEAGGTQALLMNLYRNIDRSKVQFDFLVVYKEDQFYDEEIKKLGGKVYKMSFREDLNLLKFKKDLKNFFKEHQEYKIVHCHAYTIGYFCLKAAKKANVPVRIAHSHNNETVHDLKYLPKLIMQKLFTIYATDFFACSQEAGEYLFDGKEFKVLKNAIKTTRFTDENMDRKSIREELGIEDNYVIGNVGRLHPQKNQMFLIDLFYQIHKLNLKTKLLIVGEGPLRNDIFNKIHQLGLENDVILKNNTPYIEKMYKVMDVFVLPSLFEGLGIVAIEAQASGLPVIISSTVSKDAIVTKNIKVLDLKDKKEKWIEEIMKAKVIEKDKDEIINDIKEAGYDVEYTADNLQKYYIEKYIVKEG